MQMQSFGSLANQGQAVQDSLTHRSGVSQGCQPGCLSFLSRCLSSRVSWVSNMVQQCSKRNAPVHKHLSNFFLHYVRS